ncbi:MAG: D-alanyl-D-alanine carboxypeptidase [Thermoleophilaceae bacterium]|nr:D-alanyl-D-alanine carboxypeptidase [Thermoleophilaceae bacterium]
MSPRGARGSELATQLARVAALVAAVAALVALAPARAAALAPQPLPRLESRAAILVDARTGETLLAQRPDAELAIASATKLMTARLALERTRPGEVLTAPEYDAAPAESQIGLRRGERMTVRDLMRALLLESANDAAETLAVGVSGSVGAFVREMNAEAARLGLGHTHYTNPIGLDRGDNRSSAADLARLARLLMREPAFARIVDRRQARLTSGAYPRVVRNRNLLVWRYPFVDGVKTGHTRKAGYVLVGSASGGGARVISVVLGEPSEAARDADTLELLRYGLGLYERVTAMTPTRPVARLPVSWRDERVGVAPPAPVRVTVRRGERPQLRLELPRRLQGELPRGRVVGRARVVADGRVLRTVPLVTAERVPGAGPLRRLWSGLGPVLGAMLVLAALLAATLVLLRVRAVRMRSRRSRTTSR